MRKVTKVIHINMVQLTKTLLVAILKQYEQNKTEDKFSAEDWADMYLASMMNAEELNLTRLVMPWGKYRGQILSDIHNMDPKYLRLIYQNKEIFDGTKFEDLDRAIQILTRLD